VSSQGTTTGGSLAATDEKRVLGRTSQLQICITMNFRKALRFDPFNLEYLLAADGGEAPGEIAERVAHIVEAKGMSELGEDQADDVAPMGEGPGVTFRLM